MAVGEALWGRGQKEGVWRSVRHSGERQRELASAHERGQAAGYEQDMRRTAQYPQMGILCSGTTHG
eukprot:359124-Chlamydomonas_euryale.AAC.6